MLNKSRHNNVSRGGGVSNGEENQDPRDRNKSSQQIEWRKKLKGKQGPIYWMPVSLCDNDNPIDFFPISQENWSSEGLNNTPKATQTVDGRSRTQSRYDGKTCILYIGVIF